MPSERKSNPLPSGRGGVNKTSEIIRRLGGTSKVAKMCGIASPSVSEWKRRNVIPRGWVKYFKAIRPDVFGQHYEKDGDAT